MHQKECANLRLSSDDTTASPVADMPGRSLTNQYTYCSEEMQRSDEEPIRKWSRGFSRSWQAEDGNHPYVIIDSAKQRDSVALAVIVEP